MYFWLILYAYSILANDLDTQSSPQLSYAQTLHTLAISTLEFLNGAEVPKQPQIVKPKGLKNALKKIIFYFFQMDDNESKLPAKRVQTFAKSADVLPSTEVPEISPKDSPSMKRIKAERLLEIAGYELKHAPSVSVLGEMFLYGAYSHSRNTSKALDHFLTLAKDGNATAQRIVGLMYANAIGSERSYPKVTFIF